MMQLVVLGGVVVAAVVWLQLSRADPQRRAQIMRRLPFYILGGAVVVLALTGRMHWLMAVVAAAVPVLGRLLSLLRYAPIVAQLYTAITGKKLNPQGGSAAGKSGESGPRPGTSEVRTEFLLMSLDHGTGVMSGQVLRGRFQGKTLAGLGRAELLQFYAECEQADAESAALMAAYLDREAPNWRDAQGAGGAAGAGSNNAGGGPMSQTEAADILGVAASADRKEIIAAHRRLMQKLHPDRGGSTYLAAKINAAKERLLKS